MATDSSKASWRKSTFDPQKPLRGTSAWARGPSRPSSYAPRSAPAVTAMQGLPPDRNFMERLHPTALKSLERKAADPDAEEVRIENCDYLGSYNWTNRETPTIIVPGAPRHWLNRSAPYNVQPDVGLTFVDQNGYRMPNAPLVPLIAAVTKRLSDTPDLEFDWSSVDFVIDRNGLRKLLRWVRNEDKMRDFRMDLELAGGKTVLVNRWETKTREAFCGRTFGFNFEKASTEAAPGCPGATGYHRIVTYDLGGLKMVVRFEVDACLPPTRSRKSIDAAAVATDSVDNIASLLAAASLGNSTTTDTLTSATTTEQSNYSIDIIQGGYEVKAPTIMELTTCSQNRFPEFKWGDRYPQLYFSQTPHHVLAVHTRGRFIEIQRRKQSDALFQQFEKELKPDLKDLRKALGDIQKLVLEAGKSGRLSLVCRDGILKVYERTSEESCLPDHMMTLFD